MQKAPFVFPIIGGRKVEQLLANLEALDILLTDEHLEYLESIIPFDPGFPSSMIVGVCLLSNIPQSYIVVNREMELSTTAS